MFCWLPKEENSFQVVQKSQNIQIYFNNSIFELKLLLIKYFKKMELINSIFYKALLLQCLVPNAKSKLIIFSNNRFYNNEHNSGVNNKKIINY